MVLLAIGVTACGSEGSSDVDPALEEGTELPDEDLGAGEMSADDMKADGVWGHATECKPIPDLPRLTNPKIVISINGLTLRLSDASTGFEKVFPIGPGAINQKQGETTSGESLSLYPILS
jgi:hypothetical protein